MRLSLLALTALLVPHAASAENWRLAAYSDNEPQTAYFVDVDSIRRTGTKVTFRQQTIYSALSPTRDFDRSMLTRDADCSELSSTMYNSSFFAKGVHLGDEAGPSKPTVAKPGTILETMLKTVCGIEGDYYSPGVATPEVWVQDKFRSGFG